MGPSRTDLLPRLNRILVGVCHGRYGRGDQGESPEPNPAGLRHRPPRPAMHNEGIDLLFFARPGLGVTGLGT